MGVGIAWRPQLIEQNVQLHGGIAGHLKHLLMDTLDHRPETPLNVIGRF